MANRVKNWRHKITQWKCRIMVFAMGELRYARRIYKQAEKDVERKERDMRKQGANFIDVYNMREEFHSEIIMYKDDVQEIQSKKWIMEADKFSIPIPQRPFGQGIYEDPTGYWKLHSANKTWILTTKGVHYIRNEVRNVQKTERDRRLSWLQFLIPTGIALAALIVSVVSNI